MTSSPLYSISFSLESESEETGDGVSWSEEEEAAETLSDYKDATSTDDCSKSSETEKVDSWVTAEKVLSVSYCPNKLIAR